MQLQLAGENEEKRHGLGEVLAAVFAGFALVVPTFLAMTAPVVIGCPMPGRGPRLFSGRTHGGLQV